MKIVREIFGSQLYGTSTPSSDLDYKSVYIPSAHDILLQRVRPSISVKRSKGDSEKNFAGEVDEECYSLDKFLSLVKEGQTVTLDMLFVPETQLLETSYVWETIIRNRNRLISKESKAFIGYCMQQAKKYGIKGSRVAAVRETLNFLKRMEVYGVSHKLKGCHVSIQDFIKNSPNKEFIKLFTVPQKTSIPITFLEVCGRKMSYTASLKNAIDTMQHLMDEYGQRAIMAETNLGVDYKAMSHAIRIAQQAIELFNTGFITFPRPNADFLLDIKQGRLPYCELAEIIETLLPQVLDAAENSNLPEKVDIDFIDEFIFDTYKKQVKGTLYA